MIYTDENGDKFEGVGAFVSGADQSLGGLLIKPIKNERKVIDWSKVADGVAVRFNSFEDNMRGVLLDDWTRQDASGLYFDTDHWHAWLGGECPLPEGVMVELRLRGFEDESGEKVIAANVSWENHGIGSDIIAYRVTGLADGWSYPE